MRRCKQCGEDISHKGRDAIFCNNNCGSVFRNRARKPKNRKCKQCGEDISHKAITAKVCGQLCYGRSNRPKPKPIYCKFCKVWFTPLLPRVTHCCAECSRQSRWKQDKRTHCKQCGEPLKDENKTRRGGGKTYCNNRCRRRYYSPHFPPKPQNCPGCGTLFSPLNEICSRTVYCSKDCMEVVFEVIGRSKAITREDVSPELCALFTARKKLNKEIRNHETV